MAVKKDEAPKNLAFLPDVQCGGCKSMLVPDERGKLSCITERCQFKGKHYDVPRVELVEVQV